MCEPSLVEYKSTIFGVFFVVTLVSFFKININVNYLEVLYLIVTGWGFGTYSAS